MERLEWAQAHFAVDRGRVLRLHHGLWRGRFAPCGKSVGAATYGGGGRPAVRPTVRALYVASVAAGKMG